MDSNFDEVTTNAIQAVSKEIYADLVHPAANNLGKTGGSLTRAAHAIFGRSFDAIALKCELYWDKVERKIRASSESIPVEYRQEPSISIAKSVCDGLLVAIDSEDLQKLFINILHSSMDKRTASGILAVYPEVLKQLCSDEARLLRYFITSQDRKFPLLEIRNAGVDSEQGWTVVETNISLVAYDAKCRCPQNSSVYLENLQRLGLIALTFDKHFVDDSVYEPLKKSEKISRIQVEIEKDPSRKCEFVHGLFRLTNLGVSFCQACKISELDMSDNL